MREAIALRVYQDEVPFARETFEAALEEAKEVLARHENEEPPSSDTQTTSEAAEDYVNLVASQQRRVQFLERVLTEVELRD